MRREGGKMGITAGIAEGRRGRRRGEGKYGRERIEINDKAVIGSRGLKIFGLDTLIMV